MYTISYFNKVAFKLDLYIENESIMISVNCKVAITLKLKNALRQSWLHFYRLLLLSLLNIMLPLFFNAQTFMSSEYPSKHFGKVNLQCDTTFLLFLSVNSQYYKTCHGTYLSKIHVFGFDVIFVILKGFCLILSPFLCVCVCVRVCVLHFNVVSLYLMRFPQF